MSLMHPLHESPRHTIHQVRAKLREWYGIEDPDRWYQLERARLLKFCRPDPHGIARHETLEDYWLSRQQERRWFDFDAGTEAIVAWP